MRASGSICRWVTRVRRRHGVTSSTQLATIINKRIAPAQGNAMFGNGRHFDALLTFPGMDCSQKMLSYRKKRIERGMRWITVFRLYCRLFQDYVVQILVCSAVVKVINEIIGIFYQHILPLLLDSIQFKNIFSYASTNMWLVLFIFLLNLKQNGKLQKAKINVYFSLVLFLKYIMYRCMTPSAS